MRGLCGQTGVERSLPSANLRQRLPSTRPLRRRSRHVPVPRHRVITVYEPSPAAYQCPTEGALRAAQLMPCAESDALQLRSFDPRICLTYGSVQALPSTITAGYIRVDGRPAKQALSTWISKWVYLYTSYLQTKVCTTDPSLQGRVCPCLCSHCSEGAAQAELSSRDASAGVIALYLTRGGQVQLRQPAKQLLASVCAFSTCVKCPNPNLLSGLHCIACTFFTLILLLQVVATLENLFKFVAAGSTTLDISIDNGPADPVSHRSGSFQNGELGRMFCMSCLPGA